MYKKTILFIIVTILSGIIYGNPVDTNLIKTVAKNLYWERCDKTIDYGALNTRIVSTKEINNLVLYYIVDINSSGHVIISGDDNAFPILAYSLKNNYVDDNKPPQYISWMKNYELQMQQIIQNNLQADKTIKDAWKQYSNQQSPGSPLLAVAPLLSTTWAQGTNYNADCPTETAGPNGHALVGCVAVAMGQVMKYWNYPTQGTGSNSYSHTIANGYSNNYGTLSANFGTTTYGWSSMPNTLSSSSTSAQKAAVAQLLYHCGISVKMNYGPAFSGASHTETCSALKTYFNYDSIANFKDKQNFTTTAWNTMIKSDLDNGYPIIYVGIDTIPPSGHAFVLDGYQGTSNDHYNFNWGWGGYADGYFYLTSLNPGGSTVPNFTIQGAIFQIHPATATSLICSGAYLLTSGTPYNSTTIGGTSNVSTYAGSTWNESGPEKVHKIVTGSTGNITATLSNLGSNDLDVFILSACNPNNTIAYGSNTATATSAASGTYYIVVDGYNGVAGSYTLTVNYSGSGTPNLTSYTGTGAVNTYNFNSTTHVLDVTNSMQNDGTSSAGSFRVGWYLSTNTTISTSDNLVETATQSSLANGYYINKSGNIDLDNVSGLSAGTYYVGVIFDDLNNVSESNENDNTIYFTTTMYYPGPPNPNLQIVSGNISTAGNTVTVTAVVKNTGASSSGACSLGYYASANATISTSDYLIGTDAIPILTAGDSTIESITKDLCTVSGLSNGTYYIGLIADYQNVVTESDETDNTGYFSSTVTVSCGSTGLNCTGAVTLTSGVPYNGTTIGGNSNVSTYYGTTWNESGPEKVHKIITGGTGNLTATLSNMGSNDLDVLILSACNANNTIAAGDVSANVTAVAAGTYYIVVDGYNGASGTYTLTVTSTGTVPCTYSLSPSSQLFSSTGGNGVFNVTTQSACNWTASESCSWVSIAPAWQVQANHSIVGDISGSAGCETDGTYYYVAKWSGDTIARYNMSGTLLNKFTISGVTGLRDLAYDGTYFYGGKNTNLIYKMNFNSSPPSLVSTITCPSALTIRNICYQPDSSAFWVGGWATDLSLVSMSGSVLRTISSTKHGLTSTYGTAYDTVSAGGPYIWAISAATGVNTTLTQINAYSGLPTGLTHDCSTDICTSAELGAGLWIQPNIVSNTVTLGGVIQNVKIFGYDLATAINYGSGSGVVNYTVDTNLTTSLRTCNISVGGQTHIVNQSGASSCTYSLSSNSQSFTSSAGTGSFNVTTQTGCAWAATESCSWVTITSGSNGTGNGTVNYSITANTTTSQRSCTINVQGQLYVITQAFSCSYILSPTSLNFTASSGTGSFSVQTQTGCAWTASESCSWITITSGSSGTGNGTVNYSVGANSSTSPRSCIITVQGQSYTITQSGNCNFVLSGTGQNFTHTGGTGSFTIQTSTGCSWTANESCSWLSITSSNSGTGNGSISFSVTANTSTSQRTCVITVEGQTYTVIQSGAPCTYTLSPISQNFTFAGGNSYFNVQTLSGCNWTATESCTWVSITSGSSGSGTGAVNFSVDPNSTSSTRTCIIDVQGQSFTITQDAGGLKPVADFVASQTSGVVPMSVDFIDNSTNSPTSWAWSFYGASLASSNMQNPTNIIYNNPGSFAVKLVATNAFGSDSEIKGSYITVSPSGIIDISNEEDIFIYPNPTHNLLYIDSQTKIGIVEISNMLGEIVYKGFNKNKIDISHLSNGVYVINIFDKSNELLKRERVMKY